MIPLSKKTLQGYDFKGRGMVGKEMRTKLYSVRKGAKAKGIDSLQKPNPAGGKDGGGKGEGQSFSSIRKFVRRLTNTA